jgi:hypothetical protein
MAFETRASALVIGGFVVDSAGNDEFFAKSRRAAGVSLL